MGEEKKHSMLFYNKKVRLSDSLLRDESIKRSKREMNTEKREEQEDTRNCLLTSSMLSRIKSLCQSRGVSLSDLANELGYGLNSISRWDKNKPSIDKVIAVADFFEVSLDYLCERTEIRQTTNSLFEMLDDSYKSNFTMSNDDYKMIKAFHNAPKRIRKAIQLLLDLQKADN